MTYEPPLDDPTALGADDCPCDRECGNKDEWCMYNEPLEDRMYGDEDS